MHSALRTGRPLSIAIGNLTIDKLGHPDATARIKAALPSGKLDIHLQGSEAIPYRCIGADIHAATGGP